MKGGDNMCELCDANKTIDNLKNRIAELEEDNKSMVNQIEELEAEIEQLRTKN